MRALTDHEKRTIRLGSIVLLVGLVAAAAMWSAKRLEARRAAYRDVLREARDLRAEIDRYHDKADLAQKLIDTYRLDPMTLARTSLVAKASAAIQKASGETGVGAGAIRESATHGSGKEISSIQFEGTGQLASIMSFLYKLERTGSPLIIESMRLTPDSHRPDMLKVNLTIVVLDFDQWKTEEKPNA